MAERAIGPATPSKPPGWLMTGKWPAADTRPGYHPGKTGVVLLDGHEVALVGQIDPRMQRSFDVRLPVYACRIFLQSIPVYEIPQFKPPSKFPATTRDLAIVCDVDLPAARLERALRSAAGSWCTAAAGAWTSGAPPSSAS